MKKERWVGVESSQQMFQLTTKRPDFWFGNAESYERAASILFDTIKEEAKITLIPNEKGRITIPRKELHPPIGGPHALLAGLSIENELKAILIALDPDKFVAKEGLHRSFTKHNLQELAEKANDLRPGIIPLEDSDKATLDRLQLAIEGGKYNVGRTPRDYDKIFRLGLGISGGKGGHGLKYACKLTPSGDALIIDESSDDIAAFNELFGSLKHIYRSLVGPASE
jgi:hypothetical protein